MQERRPSRGGDGVARTAGLQGKTGGLHRLRWPREVYKSMIKGLAGGVDRGGGVLGDSSEEAVGVASASGVAGGGGRRWKRRKGIV